VNALVTGAHGFIGSHLAEGLLAAGHRVRALVSPWGDLANLRDVLGEVEIARADIRAPEALDDAFTGIDVVFHAAARVADWGAWPPFYETNVLGTANVLRAATGAGVQRLVHVSSVAVHRYRGYRDADPRTAPLDGDLNAYARSKRLAERRVAAATDLETVIVRPGAWPFGPRDPVIAQVTRALRAPAFPLVGGGGAVLNTAYVGNLVGGLILAGVAAEAAGRVYLIADEGAPSWREVLAELARLTATRPRWLTLPPALAAAVGTGTEGTWRLLAPGRTPPVRRYLAALMRHDLHFSTRHARVELGYRPQVSWQAGLARTVAGLA
jgi:2-alkyl-3-oxoalkanoate reductase